MILASVDSVRRRKKLLFTWSENALLFRAKRESVLGKTLEILFEAIQIFDSNKSLVLERGARNGVVNFVKSQYM